MSGFLANALTRSLARIFRDGASLTSVSKLRREGYKTVSVLRLSRLEELVGAAIEKIITEVTSDPETGRRAARGAQVELIKMLGERDSIARATEDLKREQRSLERNVGQLHSALDQARNQLREQVEAQGKEAVSDLHLRFQRTLDELFGRVGGEFSEDDTVGRALQELRSPLEDSFLSLLGAAVRRSAPDQAAPSGEAGNKVALLERRVRKLNASLEEARSMMSRLRDNRNAEDDGVASIYKEVQGLSGTEESYEQRKALMQEIFNLNVELRRDISGV